MIRTFILFILIVLINILILNCDRRSYSSDEAATPYAAVAKTSSPMASLR